MAASAGPGDVPVGSGTGRAGQTASRSTMTPTPADTRAAIHDRTSDDNGLPAAAQPPTRPKATNPAAPQTGRRRATSPNTEPSSSETTAMPVTRAIFWVAPNVSILQRTTPPGVWATRTSATPTTSDGSARRAPTTAHPWPAPRPPPRPRPPLPATCRPGPLAAVTLPMSTCVSAIASPFSGRDEPTTPSPPLTPQPATGRLSQLFRTSPEKTSRRTTRPPSLSRPGLCCEAVGRGSRPGWFGHTVPWRLRRGGSGP